MVLILFLFASLAPLLHPAVVRAAVLPVGSSTASSEELLSRDDRFWRGLPDTEVSLNRTPPLYEGDPQDDGYRPALHASLASNGTGLFVRVRWTDDTESVPRPAERTPDAGDPSIYKAHSLDIERFSDAACIMVPLNTGKHAAYPPLMMGDRTEPVGLYFWHAQRGFTRLEGAGRGATQTTGQSFPGSVGRTASGWEAVFQLPALAPGTPMSFALWDGDKAQRDGLKFFSLWLEVRP